MAEDTVDPQGHSTTITQDPPNADTPNQDEQLPERFKGKTANQIAKDYLELQKKIGEQGEQVAQTKQQLADKEKLLQQYDALGKVIQSDPALYYQIEGKIKSLSQQRPSQQPTDPSNQKTERDLTDVKLSAQNQIFTNFESKFGINNLSEDQAKSLQSKIGKELAEMTGAKDVPSAIASLSLDRLPLFLEKAYRLATDGDDQERARLKGMLDARRNNQASFGNVPSSSIRENPNGLSPEEKNVAKRLGVTEEKYLKNKQAQYN
jgi:phage I-like protein